MTAAPLSGSTDSLSENSQEKRVVRHHTEEEVKRLLPHFTLMPRAWAALTSTDVIALTGRTRWDLASDRIWGGGGLPYFSKGLLVGNRTYYVAGPVLWPDLPFWQACRLGCGRLLRTDPDAGPEEVWDQVEIVTSLNLYPSPYRPRSWRQMLDEVRPLFEASAQ